MLNSFLPLSCSFVEKHSLGFRAFFRTSENLLKNMKNVCEWAAILEIIVA